MIHVLHVASCSVKIKMGIPGKRGCREILKMVHIVSLFLVLALLQLVRCADVATTPTCEKVSSCECKFSDGSGVISLTTLANSNDQPRFDFNKGTQPGPYLYAYNPCNGFSYKPPCENVAACQRNSDGSEVFDIGDQKSADFSPAGDSITYKAMDGTTPKTSVVHLICVQSATTPILEVLGEAPSNHYEFNLKSNCACKNGCIGGLSGGSVLCILFSVVVIVYIVGGVLFLKFVRGAEGKELIPNYEFWTDLPLLIKDGVLFVGRGCKAESNNYEQI